MKRPRLTIWISIVSTCVALSDGNALGGLSETLVLKGSYSVPQWSTSSGVRSIAFDGPNLWTSQTTSWSSSLYKHNMDATLSVAGVYGSSSVYLTEMTFVNGALWTSDNMSNRTVRYAVGNPTSEVARYGQPGLTDGAHGITFDGSAFWLAQANNLARVDYPSGTLLGTWQPGFASVIGVEWDPTRNSLWVLDQHRPSVLMTTTLREYKFDGTSVTEVASYDLWPYLSPYPGDPTIRVAAGLDVSGGYIWTSDYFDFELLQFELQPVPVPGALVLGAIGLSFSGLLCRRRRETLSR